MPIMSEISEKKLRSLHSTYKYGIKQAHNIPPTPLIIIIIGRACQNKNKRYLTIGLTREG